MKNARTFWKLTLLAAVLAGGHLLVSLRHDDKHGTVRGNTLMPGADEALAITILRDGTESVTMTNAGGWKLEWPVRGDVDSKTVAALTDALAFAPMDDMLSDVELMKLGRTHADFELDTPRLSLAVNMPTGRVEVDFGVETPSGEGVYATVSGENRVFVVPKRAFEAIDVTLGKLRRRNLFAISDEEVMSVDIRLEAGKFSRIERGNRNNERFVEFLAALLSAEAKEFIWPVGGENESSTAGMSLLAGYGLDPETAATVTLHGVDGMDRTISFGKGAGDGLVFALVFGGGAIVTVDSKLKYDLIEGGDAFDDSRLFPMEAGEVNSVNIAENGVNYLLQRDQDGDWQLESPVAASADRKAAESLVGRIVKLRTSDLAEDGVTLSVSTNRAPVKVRLAALADEEGLVGLRSREILSVDPLDVKRLVGGGASVEFNPERKVWMVETSANAGKVDEAAVEAIVAELKSLAARRVVKLKVSEPELESYGLGEPQYRLAIDLATAGVSRKNILIGSATRGGYYATLGSADAVFVISEQTKKILTAKLLKDGE